VAEQVVVDRRQLDGGLVVRDVARQFLNPGVDVEQQRPFPSSRTMLWIQKNDATRAPRVTGVTRWRLVAG